MSSPQDDLPTTVIPQQTVEQPAVTTAPATRRARIWNRKLPARIGRARTSTVIIGALFVLLGGLNLVLPEQDPLREVVLPNGATVRVPASQYTPAPTTPSTTAPAEGTTEVPTTPTTTPATTSRAPRTTAPEDDQEPAPTTTRTTQQQQETAPTTSRAPSTTRAPATTSAGQEEEQQPEETAEPTG